MTGWGSITLAEAQSIRFYSDEDKTTELAREVVSADEIHVKVPSLTSSSEIYVTYDGIRSLYASTDTYGAQNVWTNSYVAVWHPENAGVDSTSYGNDLTANGDATVSTGGKLGDAFYFDGSGDYYRTSSIPSFADINAYTISAWSYLNTIGTTSDADDGAIFSYNQANTNVDLLWYNVNAGGTGDRVYTFNAGAPGGAPNNRVNGSITPTAANWHYIVGTRNVANRTLYYNGSVDEIQTAGATSNNAESGTVRIGGWGITANMDLNGRLDSVRLATTTRSADWIASEYNNQNDVGTFWGTVTDAGGAPPAATQAARRLFLMSM